MCEAIESALAQTYSNVEVLVINDGSTDNTGEIAKSYGDKIRYFSKENGGVASALNLGIKEMHGEYFSWLSHDDLYTPDKVEKNIEALKNDRYRIVYSDFSHIDKDGNFIGIISAKNLHPTADYEYWLFPIIFGLIHGCSLLLHRKHFQEHGVFDEHLKCTQDFDLWFRMFRNQKLIYLDEVLVKGRQHEGQTSVTSEKNTKESDILWVKMLTALTEEDIIKLSGSELNFWSFQVPFLEVNTNNKNSIKYAKYRLNKCRGSFIRRFRLALKLHGVIGTLKAILRKLFAR